MITKELVLDLLEELCESDEVKDNLDINFFQEGLLDSFGTVTLLIEIEERFGITVGISEFVREEWDTPNKVYSQLESRK
jgi:D-alanine--poly(phosphoribitol) ligase subunit 2